MSAEDVSGFWEGFTSLDDVAYVPFASGFADLADAKEMYNEMKTISAILEEGGELTQEQQAILTLHQLNNITDGRVKEMSTWTYGAGALTGVMLPYVGEFIATGGAFTSARVSTQVALKGVLKLTKKQLNS